jgi:hypothetical protein
MDVGFDQFPRVCFRSNQIERRQAFLPIGKRRSAGWEFGIDQLQ